jgi:hypothetical protein
MRFPHPRAEIQIHRVLNRPAMSVRDCFDSLVLQDSQHASPFMPGLVSPKPQLNLSGVSIGTRVPERYGVVEAVSMRCEDPILCDQEVEFFREQGFLSRPSLTAPEEVAKIRSMLEELFKTRRGENEGTYSENIDASGDTKAVTASEILNPANYAPSLRKTKCFKNALKIAKQLLGDDAFCFFDFSVLKKPVIGVATPWHQDEAFRDPQFESNEVTIWVPLQDVDVDNGCMQFIPRSHRRGILGHDSPNHDLSSTALECVDFFDKTTAAPCPLPAGGCTIHHPRTLHGTGLNLRDASRLAYIMVFSLPRKLTNKARTFTWLEQKRTVAFVRKRRWMRRGGLLITIWRRVRRAEFVRDSAFRNVLKRTSRIFQKGI